ncbi:MAG: exodeoxyribonuclease III [Peptococcaceae bacterium BICA1-7]|nr:MAG: exodeoxyribonuclease III [Peptococcaceae bacterium BICA1-7]HBV97528.1 exodeoxyribonuclease III [Desulfotomaculum sp.]
MLFKIASFNANSIRSRLGVVLDWLEKERPDVLCLQETKVEDGLFPAAEFLGAGYNVIFKGQKSYNGVAIASPHPIGGVVTDDGGLSLPGEARLIAANIKGVHIVNTYIPQGQSPSSEKFTYKLNWIRGLRDFFHRSYSNDMMVAWAGDFNVAPEPIDVHDPKRLYGKVGFHPEEHEALKYVREWGFTDVFRLHEKEGGHYSFWDYRVPQLLRANKGWRVDHIWATRKLAHLSRRAWIDREPRLREKPSDHTFIVAEFEV